MLVAITEANAWEHERWTYVLDADKQGAEILNLLTVFCRLATKEADKMKEAVTADINHPWVRDMLGRPLYKLYAASHYTIRFYDSVEVDASRDPYRPVLIEGKRKMHFSFGDGGYKNGGLLLNTQISPHRLASAMVGIRDRKENKIYKDFESLFLKKKATT